MTILRLAVPALMVAHLLMVGVAKADMSPDDAVDKMTQLNKEAVTAYQAQKFDDARKILKQALDLAASAGIETHPITARTHIHLGIVIIGGFKQRDLGIKQFKKALELQPDINLTKSLVTPDLADAFSEAKTEAKNEGKTGAPGGGGAKPTPPAPTPPAASPPPTEETPPATPATSPPAETPPASTAPEEAANGLSHEPVSEASQGSAISITVGVGDELQFDKIVLAYRPDGATDFLGREMKQVAAGRYGAEIPPGATTGGTVAYYVEAEDKDGAAVASKGSIDNPMVIHLIGVGARRPSTNKDEGEEEDEGPDHRFSVALLVGTGFGWATGSGDTNSQTSISPAGLALAGPAVIAPEVGYWLNSSLMLSLQLRYQFITGTTDIYCSSLPAQGSCAGDPKRVFHTANYAFAAFAKATWRFGEGRLHPFVSLALGGGQIRHIVSFGNQGLKYCGQNGTETCKDTIGAGPVLAGPGGGVSFDMTDRFALVAQVNAVLGFPNFTANADIGLGAAVGF